MIYVLFEMYDTEHKLDQIRWTPSERIPKGSFEDALKTGLSSTWPGIKLKKVWDSNGKEVFVRAEEKK